MAEELLKRPLPSPWSYAVTDDGRIFFIDEERRITTWIHPLLNRPLQTGHFSSPELPPTWEMAYTATGRRYFLDHFNQKTSFDDPRVPAQPQFDSQNTGNFTRDVPGEHSRSSHRLLRSSSKRKSGRRKSTGSIPVAKRNYDIPASKKGWLQKQESGLVKQWKKRWCVISELCFFCYEGVNEEDPVASVILPGYQIHECSKADGINQKFAFKVQHDNTKVLYFSASSEGEMIEWINELRRAAQVDSLDGLQFQPNTPASLRRPEQDNRNWNNENYNPGYEMSQPNHNHPQTPSQSLRNPAYLNSQSPGGPPQNNGYNPYNSDGSVRRQNDTNDVRGRDPYQATRPQDPYQARPEGPDPRQGDPRWGPDGPIYSSVRKGGYSQPNLNKSFSSEGMDQLRKDGGQSWRNPGSVRTNGTSNGDRWGDAAAEGGVMPSQPPESVVLVKLPAKSHLEETKLVRQQSSRNARDGNTKRNDSTGNGAVPLYHKESYNHETLPRNQEMRDDFDHPYSGSFGPDRPVLYDQTKPDRFDGSVELRHPRKDDKMQQPGINNQPNQDYYNGGSRRPNPGEELWNPAMTSSQYDGQHMTYLDSDLNNQRLLEPNPYGKAFPSNQSSSSVGLHLDRYSGHYRDSRDEIELRNPSLNQSILNQSFMNQSTFNNTLNQSTFNNNNPALNQSGFNNTLNHSTFNNNNPALNQSGFSNNPALNQSFYSHRSQDFSNRRQDPIFYSNVELASPRFHARNKHPYASHTGYPEQQRSSNISNSAPHNFRLSDGFIDDDDDLKFREPLQRKRSFVDLSLTHSRKLNQLEKETNLSGSLDKLRDGLDLHNSPEGAMRQLATRAEPPRDAYQQHTGFGGKPLKQQMPPAGSPVMNRRPPNGPTMTRGIDVIKEDPDMPDSAVQTTRTLQDLQKHLSGHARLRLSISTDDLKGKSHEELTLLLIQLKRSQTQLEEMRNWARERLRENTPDQTPEYRQQLKKHTEEVEKQIEITQPLINLLNNIVTMGSLFGGDNALYASQYKKDSLASNQTAPSKKMLDFSRKHQEQQLVAQQEKSMRQLTEDQVDLDKKLEQLHALDSLLQQRSVEVTLLQEDKNTLDRALDNIIRQIEQERDSLSLERLNQQRQIVEGELSSVRHQLAEASKLVEETNAESTKVEQQVMMLRSKVYGMNKSQSNPALATGMGQEREKLEQELEQVQQMMNGLSSQGGKLSKTVANLKSSADLGSNGPRNNSTRNGSTYMETDLDTQVTRDISKRNSGKKHPHLEPFSNTKQRNPSSSNFVAYEYGSDGIQFHSIQPLTPKITTIWQRAKSIDETNAEKLLEAGPLSQLDKSRYSVREVKKREVNRRGPDVYPIGNLQRSTSMPKVSHMARSGNMTSQPDTRSTDDLYYNKNSPSRRTLSQTSDAERRFTPNGPSLSQPQNFRQGPQKPPSQNNYQEPRKQQNFYQQREPGQQYEQPRYQQQQSQKPDYPKHQSDYPKEYQKYIPDYQKEYQKYQPQYQSRQPGYQNQWRDPGPLNYSRESEGPKYVAVATVRPVPTGANSSRSSSLMGETKDRIAQNLKTQEFHEYPENYSADIIDRELQRPDLVEIPERYAADLDESDDVFLSHEERLQKQGRSEQYKKTLAAHSLQDFKREELTLRYGDIRDQVDDEKRRREQILDVKQQLAEQVKQKSKEAAAQRRLASPVHNIPQWQMS